MDNRERARARDKKQTRRGLLEKQHENFISAVKFCEKTRNATGRQGEASKVKMGGNEKKKRTGTQATKSLVSSYDIFFRKMVKMCN